MKNTQEHPVVNLELERTVLVVIVASGIFLCLKKAFSNIL
jgi:hypothetical protein